MWALFVGLALTIRYLNVSGILWYPCLTCGWFNSFVLVISARLLFFPIDLFHATCRETFVLQENVSISLYRRPSRSSELLGQVNGTGRLGPLSVSYVCPNKTVVPEWRKWHPGVTPAFIDGAGAVDRSFDVDSEGWTPNSELDLFSTLSQTTNALFIFGLVCVVLSVPAELEFGKHTTQRGIPLRIRLCSFVAMTSCLESELCASSRAWKLFVMFASFAITMMDPVLDRIYKTIKKIANIVRPCVSFFLYGAVVFGLVQTFATVTSSYDTLAVLEQASANINAVQDNIARLHAALDVDDDGAISIDDTVKNMKTVFNTLDKNKDGELSYDDFPMHAVAVGDSAVGNVAAILDSNSDGFLTVEDVQDHVYEAADLDGDGTVKRYELLVSACSVFLAWLLTRRHYKQKLVEQQKTADENMRRFAMAQAKTEQEGTEKLQAEQERLVLEKNNLARELERNEQMRVAMEAKNFEMGKQISELTGEKDEVDRLRVMLLKQQAELAAQEEKNTREMRQKLAEFHARECAFCHAALATAVNKPCGCRLLCRTCSNGYRLRNGEVCPNPNCSNTAKTTIEDENDCTTMTCIICAETWESNCVFKVSEGCDHLICIGCMVDNVKIGLQDRSLFDAEGLKCPRQQCTQHVKNKIHQMKDIARKVLPDPNKRTDATPLTEDECKQYIRFMHEASIPAERRIWCKNPDCKQQEMVMDVGTEHCGAPHKFLCFYCNSEAYALCTKCKQLHHPEIADCERARASRNANGKSDVFIKLTSKLCPHCSTSTTHFHGHGCHHIMPGGGCPSCHKHWCFACGTASERELHSNYCGSDPHCRLFCKTDDIQNFIDDSSGYPIDRRCSCPICSDCRPDRPCESCDGGCVVCLGLAPPGKLVGHAAALVNDGAADYGVGKTTYDQTAMAAAQRKYQGKKAPLCAALRAKDEDAAEALLDGGADPNEVDGDGMNALHRAAWKGCRPPLLQRVLARIHDVNAGNDDGRTALMFAARYNHLDVVTSLLNHPGIDVNVQDRWKQTALHYAAGNNHPAIVSQLLSDDNINANLKNDVNSTPLKVAIANYNHECVKILQDYGAKK